MIVGPNGAGKTTLYERIIAPDRPGLPFVNADRIAAERWPGEELARSYDAAQIAARARAALIDARLDLCAETVFSHPSKVDLVLDSVNAGYDVTLHVVMIPLQLSGPRVQRRVAAGGHDVPAAKLADRYRRLWQQVATAMPHCARAVFWDNSTDEGPFEIGSFRYGIPDHPARWPAWAPAILRHL